MRTCSSCLLEIYFSLKLVTRQIDKENLHEHRKKMNITVAQVSDT